MLVKIKRMIRTMYFHNHFFKLNFSLVVNGSFKKKTFKQYEPI